MARKGKFTVDASSVQDVEGATITFRTIRRKAWREWIDKDSKVHDDTMIEKHVVSWHGIKDDNGNELPSPAEDAAVIDELYMPEIKAITQLLHDGPSGDKVKN